MTETPDHAIALLPRAAELLERRNREAGNLLLSERAVWYVSILAALLDFRRRHEPEPLHDDLFAALCADMADGLYSQESFNQDLRQLLLWNLLTDRL